MFIMSVRLHEFHSDLRHLGPGWTSWSWVKLGLQMALRVTLSYPPKDVGTILSLQDKGLPGALHLPQTAGLPVAAQQLHFFTELQIG